MASKHYQKGFYIEEILKLTDIYKRSKLQNTNKPELSEIYKKLIEKDPEGYDVIRVENIKMEILKLTQKIKNLGIERDEIESRISHK